MRLLKNNNNRILRYNNRLIYTDINDRNYPTTFTKIANLVNDIESGDKLYILIRHGAKNSEGGLSELGQAQATYVGSVLQPPVFELNNSHYESSIVSTNRTRDTAYCISQGKTDTITTDDIIQTSLLNDSAYGSPSDIGDWNDLHDFCANPANKDFIASKSEEILNHMFIADSQFNAFISHDYVLAPMMTYISNYGFIPDVVGGEYIVQVVNGIAVIKKPSGKKIYYLLDGLS